jgi:hypothetical protein
MCASLHASSAPDGGGLARAQLLFKDIFLKLIESPTATLNQKAMIMQVRHTLAVCLSIYLSVCVYVCAHTCVPVCVCVRTGVFHGRRGVTRRQ